MPILQPFTQEEKNKTRLAQSTAVTAVSDAASVATNLSRLKDGTDTAAFLKGTKVASGQGFRCPVGDPSFATSNYVGGLRTFRTAVINDDNPAASAAVVVQWVFVFDYPGSVIAVSAYGNGVANSSYAARVYKNGVFTNFEAVVFSGTQIGRNVAPKGSYPYAAGDTLTLWFNGTAGVNVIVQAHVIIEMDPT